MFAPGSESLSLGPSFEWTSHRASNRKLLKPCMDREWLSHVSPFWECATSSQLRKPVAQLEPCQWTTGQWSNHKLKAGTCHGHNCMAFLQWAFSMYLKLKTCTCYVQWTVVIQKPCAVLGLPPPCFAFALSYLGEHRPMVKSENVFDNFEIQNLVPSLCPNKIIKSIFSGSL